jgi:menaquinol-cytochrome c reductase iron-sulfur subunit
MLSSHAVANDDKTSRRGALGTLVAGGVVGCGALAVPAVRFLIAPALGGSGSGYWIRTVPVDSLTDGEPKRVALIADRHDAWTLEKNVQLGAAWLLRRGDDVKAWTTVCPHLGCAVDRDPAGGPGFYCPCHDSNFGSEGEKLNGPSPRGLDELQTRVDGGVVMVEYRRFRQGIPDKEAVG